MMQLLVEGSASMPTESSGCQSHAKKITSVPTQSSTYSDISKRRHEIRSIAGLRCRLSHIWNRWHSSTFLAPHLQIPNLNSLYHNRHCVHCRRVLCMLERRRAVLHCQTPTNRKKLLSLVFFPLQEQQLHCQYSQKLAHLFCTSYPA
jgi:hypothetical protein